MIGVIKEWKVIEDSGAGHNRAHGENMVEGEQHANTGRHADGVVIVMANDAAVL